MVEFRQNFGPVLWVLPFYLALTLGFFYPAAFGVAFVLGIAVTIGGLFVTVLLNSWMSKDFNVVRLMVSKVPRVRGNKRPRFWRWPSVTYLFYKEHPKEFVDGFGWTNAVLHVVNNGISHPSWNPGMKIHWVKFRWPSAWGTWDDIVKLSLGYVIFRNTAVDDHPNVAAVWVQEMIPDVMPELTAAQGKTGRELLNMVPSAMVDDDGILKWVPTFVVRMTEGLLMTEANREQKESVVAEVLTA